MSFYLLQHVSMNLQGKMHETILAPMYVHHFYLWYIVNYYPETIFSQMSITPFY